MARTNSSSPYSKIAAGLAALLAAGGLIAVLPTGSPAQSTPAKKPAPRAPRLPDFPKPDPVHAFAELKIFSADGSPLRLPVEDWDGARARAATDPAWKTFIAARRRDVDDWMEKRRDHPEWNCGWYHDFVSPKDGSHLIWTPDEPGEETLHSASDPHVKLTPKLRAAWVYEFRTAHADHMVDAALLYRLTGDRKYADWAASQLDFYADNYATWPPTPPALQQPIGKGAVRGSHLMWQSLDEAVDLCKYVQTARYLGDYATPDHKQKWTTELFLPEYDILSRTMLAIHNIACWHRTAQGFVAVYTGDAALWQKAVDGPYGVREQLTHGVTGDYLWREQSMGYNAYVVHALEPFFVFACENGYGSKLTEQMEIAENLILAPMALRFPTGQMPNPADSGAPGHVPDTALLADVAEIYPTGIGLSAAATRRDWTTLVDPIPPTGQASALPRVVTRNLESSRMALLRKGPWQVYVHYGQLTSAHSEAEALNYEAFYDQTDVTHDPGTVGYGSPLHRDFYSTGLAHNVPLVDGVGQHVWNPGKLLAFNGDAPRISVSQPTYWTNGSAQRDMAIDGNRLTDIVQISTTDGASHELGLLVQTQGKAALPTEFHPDPTLTAPGPTRPAGFRYWTDVTSGNFTDSAAIDLTYPDGRVLRLTISVPGPFTITHASTPDYPPHRREVFFAHETGTNAVFKTTLAPP